MNAKVPLLETSAKLHKMQSLFSSSLAFKNTVLSGCLEYEGHVQYTLCHTRQLMGDTWLYYPFQTITTVRAMCKQNSSIPLWSPYSTMLGPLGAEHAARFEPISLRNGCSLCR